VILIVRIFWVFLVVGLSACSSRSWQYVRLENELPDSGCVYKMQESCSLPLNKCYNWHKQRAVKFDANTVLLTNKDNLNQGSANFWTGTARSNEQIATIAEYYFCNGPKNILPPQN
jgi:hypothetical protein